MPSSACKKKIRSEEHTSELQSHDNLVCRLLLEENQSRPVPPAQRVGGHPKRRRRLADRHPVTRHVLPKHRIGREELVFFCSARPPDGFVCPPERLVVR